MLKGTGKDASASVNEKDHLSFLKKEKDSKGKGTFT